MIRIDRFKTALFISMTTFFLLFSCATAISAEKYVLFILDTSASMYGEKLLMAKRLMLQTLKNKPHNTEIALRIFNQKTKNYDEGCKDSMLALDFDDYNISSVKKKLDVINASGPTPLDKTLDESISDFFNNGKPREIILITDGDDTCGGDPCSRASDIRKYYGININVIAVDVEKPYRNKLLCVSEKSGGRFFDVKDQAGLYKATYDLLSLPTSPLIVTLKNKKGELVFGNITITDEFGDVVAETTQPLREYSPTLPVGNYSVSAVTNDGEEKYLTGISLSANTPAEITIVF